jgi:hypothetical protein
MLRSGMPVIFRDLQLRRFQEYIEQRRGDRGDQPDGVESESAEAAPPVTVHAEDQTLNPYANGV